MTDTFKTLILADVHMSNKLPYSKPLKDGLTDRFVHQLKMWSQVHKTVEENDIDAVIVLGDLFDKALVDAVTLTYTIDAIVKTPCEVYILPGNHDANTLGGRFIVEAFSKMQNERIKVIPSDECSEMQVQLGETLFEFWPLKYKSVKDSNEELAEIRSILDPKSENILLMHNSIIGAKNGGWASPDGLDQKEICKGFKRVYAGHFHKRQTFGTCGAYIGAPMHFDFGDCDKEAGFMLVDFKEGGGIEESWIETKLPKFYVLDDLSKVVAAQRSDYLRYEIEATGPQWGKLRSKATVLCKELNDAHGINATFTHKVIPHHKTRLKETGSGLIGLEDAVSKYVDATGVVKTGLDKDKLKEFGNSYLKLVEGRA